MDDRGRSVLTIKKAINRPSMVVIMSVDIDTIKEFMRALLNRSELRMFK
jgi:hypothetical protein